MVTLNKEETELLKDYIDNIDDERLNSNYIKLLFNFDLL